jgi:hypothetical protein
VEKTNARLKSGEKKVEHIERGDGENVRGEIKVELIERGT